MLIKYHYGSNTPEIVIDVIDYTSPVLANLNLTGLSGSWYLTEDIDDSVSISGSLNVYELTGKIGIIFPLTVPVGFYSFEYSIVSGSQVIMGPRLSQEEPIFMQVY